MAHAKDRLLLPPKGAPSVAVGSFSLGVPIMDSDACSNGSRPAQGCAQLRVRQLPPFCCNSRQRVPGKRYIYNEKDLEDIESWIAATSFFS